MKHTAVCLLLISALVCPVFKTDLHARTFEQAKYGNDFLSVGGGARPLGMGGAFVAITHDVLSGYWNPAGLTSVDNWQFAYMHSERFAGIVGYDYGAIAMPVDGSEGVLALSFFRQGVDGIKNTLHAWDPEQNRPREDPASYIREFSASDLAAFLSYAHPLSGAWHIGLSAKVIHSRLGPFAHAWGTSMDAGLQYRGDRYRFGLNLSDFTTMIKFWTVNEEELSGLQHFVNPETGRPETMPKGTNEYVRPSVMIGLSRHFIFDEWSLIAALDSRIRFEGRQTYHLHTGDMSFEPRAGTELSFRDLVFLRAGVGEVYLDDRGSPHVSPTIGTGLKIGAVMVDYGFSGFTGITSDLGFTHRISLQLIL